VNAGDARCGPFGTTLEQLYEWCCDNIGGDRFQHTNGRISKTHTIASLAEEYVTVVGNRDHRFFSFFAKVYPGYFEEDGSRTDGQNVHFRTFEAENDLIPTVVKFYQEVLSNRANLLPSTWSRGVQGTLNGYRRATDGLTYERIDVNIVCYFCVVLRSRRDYLSQVEKGRVG
jgi:hypothetical protein